MLIIGMPPLRDRRADIALLAVHFLRIAVPQLSFTPGALKALGNYPFPGNVRELHNLITRLAIMPRDGVSHLIDTADVRAQFVAPVLSASIWKSSPFQMRREMVMQALMVCGGDRTAAARTRHQRSCASAARHLRYGPDRTAQPLARAAMRRIGR